MSLVKKAAEDPLPSQLTIDNEPGMIFDTPEDPSSIAINSDGEYTIKRILRHRRQGRGWRLLVKWLGWPEPTWERLQQVQETTTLDAYERLLLMLDLSYFGAALLLLIRDHKGGGEGGNCDGAKAL